VTIIHDHAPRKRIASEWLGCPLAETPLIASAWRAAPATGAPGKASAAPQGGTTAASMDQRADCRSRAAEPAERRSLQAHRSSP
jgi:hypothetical protein